MKQLPTTPQLKEALGIRQKMDRLERRYSKIFVVEDIPARKSAPKRMARRRSLSAAGRRRLSENMKARWQRAKRSKRNHL